MGGPYTVSGTVGQPDAGLLSSDGYVLVGGFWSVIAALQTPDAPLLTIARAEPNVILSWAAVSTGFVLEENTDLTGTVWTEVSAPVVQVDQTNQVTVPIAIGNRFYRLKKE